MTFKVLSITLNYICTKKTPISICQSLLIAKVVAGEYADKVNIIKTMLLDRFGLLAAEAY